MPDPESRLPAEASAIEVLARHYIWKDLLQRARPWRIPDALLIELARRTQDRVPALGDPVSQVEWHIEYILALAREHLRGSEAQPEALLKVCLAARVPARLYPAGAKTLTHQAPDLPGAGRSVPCRTLLPAVVCACGKFLLICERG